MIQRKTIIDITPTPEVIMSELDRKVNIQIIAKIDWMRPPQNENEKLLREQADLFLQDTAKRFQKVVELMILEAVDLRMIEN